MTRLLIVDDEPAQLDALVRAFRQPQPELTVATSTNAQQAMAMMQHTRFELVLTDVHDPADTQGLHFLSWLQQQQPDVAVFTMSESRPSPNALEDLGVIEHFDKPVDAQAVLRGFNETLQYTARGHVQHISLASFLQVLEMERKTCTLTVTCAEKSGVLWVKHGALVGAASDDLQGEGAAIAIVAWPYPNITIARRCEGANGGIASSLGFILMEAMRVQDEALSNGSGTADGFGSIWPAPQRTWRPNTMHPSERPRASESGHPRNVELGLPSGAEALAVVDTETGNVLCASAREGCPVAELARFAAQLLHQESATLRLCSESEGVEELVLSTSSRCDVIRPLSATQFALLVFAPQETNLVMARIELEYFIAAYAR